MSEILNARTFPEVCSLQDCRINHQNELLTFTSLEVGMEMEIDLISAISEVGSAIATSCLSRAGGAT